MGYLEMQRAELIDYLIESMVDGTINKDNYNTIIVEYVNHNYQGETVKVKSEIIGAIRNKIMYTLATERNEVYKKFLL